jgi:ribosome-interacting GTPase 1
VADKSFQVSTSIWFDEILRTDRIIAAKTADLILIMLDATKSEEQRFLLEKELDAVGIRLNKRKPDVVFKKKTTGGVCFHHTRALQLY